MLSRTRRRKRIQELHAAAAKPRFGSVEDISSNEFIEKVTNSSEKAWVVCLLYKSSHAGCALLGECLAELAKKYHGTRFVKIVSTSCIPNYPDQNLPTLLLYHNRSVVKNLVGLAQFGGQRATPEQVALVLNGYGPVCVSGGGDAAAEATAAQEQVRGLLERMVQQRVREEEDESSDFDD
eukprot:GHRQ01020948.1.p1 GENE.GHRQ01020948.1~~GHRQ01020948.1.p1  ORF type:complete len:180 (+),score=72.77 GHRQ01020948.1:712-1251(+)